MSTKQAAQWLAVACAQRGGTTTLATAGMTKQHMCPRAPTQDPRAPGAGRRSAARSSAPGRNGQPVVSWRPSANAQSPLTVAWVRWSAPGNKRAAALARRAARTAARRGERGPGAGAGARLQVLVRLGAPPVDELGRRVAQLVRLPQAARAVARGGAAELVGHHRHRRAAQLLSPRRPAVGGRPGRCRRSP